MTLSEFEIEVHRYSSRYDNYCAELLKLRTEECSLAFRLGKVRLAIQDLGDALSPTTYMTDLAAQHGITITFELKEKLLHGDSNRNSGVV